MRTRLSRMFVLVVVTMAVAPITAQQAQPPARAGGGGQAQRGDPKLTEVWESGAESRHAGSD